jgi:AcrR family transcriptional regulator
MAGQMGMTAPALYRYFAIRDDLLTELILAAYRDLAGVAETAAGTERRGSGLRCGRSPVRENQSSGGERSRTV